MANKTSNPSGTQEEPKVTQQSGSTTPKLTGLAAKMAQSSAYSRFTNNATWCQANVKDMQMIPKRNGAPMLQLIIVALDGVTLDRPVRYTITDPSIKCENDRLPNQKYTLKDGQLIPADKYDEQAFYPLRIQIDELNPDEVDETSSPIQILRMETPESVPTRIVSAWEESVINTKGAVRRTQRGIRRTRQEQREQLQTQVNYGGFQQAGFDASQPPVQQAAPPANAPLNWD